MSSRPNNNFKNWISEKIMRLPSKELDVLILGQAKSLMNSKHPKEKSTHFSLDNLFTSSLGYSSAAITLTIVMALLFKTTPISDKNKLTFNESPEMIQNYKDIELMVASSELSDQDWEKIK
jgi:hypothetical protein